MLSREKFSSIHPFFKIKAVDVLWADSVQKINRHDQSQVRFCVICTPGIILFQKKKIGKYKFSRAIGYSKLQTIESDGNSLILKSSDGTKIDIIHQRIPEIITFIMGVMSSLFEPIEGKFDEKLKGKLEDAFFLFETKYPLVNRFLANAITLIDTCCDKIIEASNKLMNLSATKITFSPLIVKSQLLNPLVDAISSDQDILTLEFSSLDFHDFILPLQTILTKNQYINELIFKGIVYQGESTHLVEFFKTQVNSPINTIKFEHCEMSSNKFTNFLLAFSKFKCRITSIVVQNCIFSEETIRALMISLFHSPCFPSIREFTLSGDSLPDNTQQFILSLGDKQKCKLQRSFKFLYLDSLKFDGSEILDSFIRNDRSYFTLISITGSNMKKEMRSTVDTFRQLNEINISNSWVTKESLLSFFKCISSAKIAPSAIICNHLHMTEESFFAFYQSAKTYIYPSINTFSWENNTLKDNNLMSFFSFLSQIPNINDLSLSNTIPCSSNSVKFIVDIINSHHLSRLVIRGCGKTSFLSKFNNILVALKNKGSVRALDISGQQIDNSCFETLDQLVNSTLISILYDGQQPTSPDSLSKVIESIINNPQIVFSKWPEETVKYALSKVSMRAKGVMIRNFEILKRRFESKFSKNVNDCINYKDSIIEPSSLPKDVINISTNGTSKLNEIDFECLSKLEDDVIDLLKECMNIEEGNHLEETALSTIPKELCTELNLTKFLM